MAYLKLIRQKPEGNAVRGKLYVSNSPCPSRGKGTAEPGERGYSFLCSTLENLDYLIPPLIYRLSVTLSPKFKRLLPLVNAVPGRSGIRFHSGSKPEHSRGCILVSREMEKKIGELILSEKETYLEIN